ncbi:Aluminum-activated malate transporter 13 [Cucurbita argyrosperma subsp. argyrosperma]|nr:Aluminum-activated malate transporter 13 [Cucurbita argyrosperma subsp. argyrosperma]
MGSAVVVSIPEEIQDQRVTDDVPVDQNKNKNKNKTAAMNKFRNLFDSTRDRIKKQDMKKIFHSIKLGIALVVVSLLYLLNPLYKQVGDNAMWAIMTVIVVFEFYAGATLSKGLNRGRRRFGGGFGMVWVISQDSAGTGAFIEKKIMALARERLSTIGMGFAVCIFINLLIFPAWASDELHHSTVQSFHNLANSI